MKKNKIKLLSDKFHNKIVIRSVGKKRKREAVSEEEDVMLPEKFMERMRNLLGEEAEAFLESLKGTPYQALRLNPAKTGTEEFLSKSVFHLTPVPWERNGFYYEASDQPGKHPYHEAGVYYIQEPSAMAPAGLLEARPGEKVLDLCAAPGGKTTQLAAAMKGLGLLVSNEIHPARAKILSENVERMGISNCLVTNETPQKLSEVFADYFDRILVDAPCSGEGMFRKNEEAAEEWSPENVRMCAERQDGILDCAARLLRAGGRLVYSTCTFAPAEDEGTVARFLMRHPEFRTVRATGFGVAEESAGDADCESAAGGLAGTPVSRALFSPGRREWAVEVDGTPLKCDEEILDSLSNAIRLWPHKLQGEGHFAAVLQKDGGESAGYRSLCRNGLQKGISEKECGDYFVFEAETLRGPLRKLLPQAGCLLKFGDQLFLCPEEMPAIKGLKVLRPGLHLGTLKKNRFEPSHALALALRPEMVMRYDLGAEDPRTQDYLNGLTFPAQGPKGWYLITVDGYGLGWGKLTGGTMKNHYPKGLRK